MAINLEIKVLKMNYIINVDYCYFQFTDKVRNLKSFIPL